jgi:hypothetical protein
MRTNYNRRARREALCFGTPRPRGRRLPISRKRLALTADGDDLVLVAERIAEELDLSPELAELLTLGSPRH